MAAREAVAIMKFDDRNRYGQHGIPATVLFGGGKREKDKREPSSVDGGASSSSPANLDAGEEEDRLVRTSMHATHGAI